MKKKILLLMAVTTLGLTATTMAQVPSYVPTNGLVGWWPFNGNANDESGNGNNGTVNGATLTNDRFGNSNESYLFDGISNRISFNLNSINNLLPASTESTSAIWIKTTDLNGPLISMQGNNGIEYDFHIGTLADIVQNPGYYGILVRDNCCGTGNNAFAGNCVDDTWHMLSIVRLSDGSMKFYKDAILEYTNASGQNGVLEFNPTYMTFGSDYSWVVGSQNGCMSCNSNDQQHYSGNLDDIGIWNRALTQQEITDLYNGGCQLSVSTQPANQTININNNAQFIVGSSDTNATYQWQADLGLGFQNLSNAGQYSGTTNDTLSVSNVSLSNNNQPFRCIISNGSCADTSNIAVLSVNNCQLSVSTQPANQTININNNAQFVVGSSDTNATYQWQTDLGVGFQNLNSVGQYSGTTNDTLTISNVTMSNNNQPFRCIINSGSCTDTSATAVLTVLNNTGINENAQNNLFSVFPNPAQSSLYVKADNKLIGSVFTIYDNIGKIVKSGKLNTANTTIELGNLSNGMYLFSIGDHKKQPFKIIKE